MTPKRGEFYRRKADGELHLVIRSGSVWVMTVRKDGEDWYTHRAEFGSEYTGPIQVEWTEVKT